MATYKAEWLHQKYAGRRRPRSHYTLGRLPALVAMAPPWLANAGVPAGAARLGEAGRAGVDPRRSLPARSPRTPAERAAARRRRRARPDVVLWVDTFTNRFCPEVADAAVAGARGRRPAGAGARVRRRVLRADLDQHRPARRRPGPARRGCSTGCAAAVPDGAGRRRWSPPAWRCSGSTPPTCSPTRAPPVAARLVTLAEHLTSLPGWAPPDLAGTEVVAQPHCHHASVLGWAADEALLRRAGATLTRRRRLLRAGRQLRDGEGPLRRLGRGLRARTSAPPSARRRRRRGARRRLLLPDPARRPRRRPRPPPGRAAGGGVVSRRIPMGCREMCAPHGCSSWEAPVARGDPSARALPAPTPERPVDGGPGPSYRRGPCREAPERPPQAARRTAPSRHSTLPTSCNRGELGSRHPVGNRSPPSSFRPSHGHPVVLASRLSDSGHHACSECRVAWLRSQRSVEGHPQRFSAAACAGRHARPRGAPMHDAGQPAGGTGDVDENL